MMNKYFMCVIAAILTTGCASAQSQSLSKDDLKTVENSGSVDVNESLERAPLRRPTGCKLHDPISMRLSEEVVVLHRSSKNPRDSATLLICGLKANSTNGIGSQDTEITIIDGGRTSLPAGRCGLFSGPEIIAKSSNALASTISFCYMPN